jgi:pilus assembly protein CpaD
MKIRIVLAAVLLTGCAGADLSEHDWRIAHPVAVERHAAVAVFDGPTLSAFDRDRLGRLAAEHRRRGAGPVELVAGANAKGFAQLLAAELDGVEAMIVEGGPSPDAVTLRVPIWTARVPDCGTFERGLNPDPHNAPNSNFGCSLVRNRALMLQNPADLVRAREPTGRDGNRAADVLEKYGKGQATASQAEAGGSATVSTVGAGK